MAFTENIRLVVDVVTGNAKGQFKTLSSDIKAADGAFGKMKVAGAGAFGMLQQLGPVAALAAGTALVGFGKKAVSAFQDTALAAAKFSDATKMNIEDSSKWLEVADDLDVSEGAVSSAFRRMGVAIGNNTAGWTDLNIQVAKNADGSINLSETFLRVVDALNAMKDPTERAAAAQKLFGKGFAEVATLIGKDADTLRQSLADVGDAQIIDEGERAKAEKLRDAMKELGDVGGAALLELGEAIVPMATRFAKAAETFLTTANELGEVWSFLGKLAIGAGGEVDTVTAAMKGQGSAAQELNARLDDLIAKEQGLTSGQALALKWEGQAKSAAAAAAATETVAESFEDVAAEAATAVTAIDQVKAAFDLMKGTLTVEEGALNLDEAFLDVEEAAAAAAAAAVKGGAEATAATHDQAVAVNNLKQRVVDYGAEVLGLPPERVTEILALIDQGKLKEADAALDKAAADRTAAIKAQQQNTPAVEKAFNNAARTRVAAMNAKANAGGAESTLNNTARTRTATINAIVNAGNAAGALSDLARTRYTTIVANTRVVGAVGATGVARQHGGPVPGSPSTAVPITAHGGEYVLDAGTVAAIKSGRQSAGTGKNGALAGAGGGASLNIHFHGPVLGTKAEFGRYIDEALAESRRRGNRVA